MLTSNGNSKLGVLPSFSLPPLMTCPGATQFCRRFCYGKSGRFAWRATRAVLKRSYDASRRTVFVEKIVDEVKKSGASVFRIHVVGDFYDEKYVERWMKIASTLPGVTFYGYTRSWRVDAIARKLMLMRELPNVKLLASVDFTHVDRPKGWSTVSVEGEGEPCPHDLKLVKHCLDCRRCWEHDGDLKLRLRWFKKTDNWSPSMI